MTTHKSQVNHARRCYVVMGIGKRTDLNTGRVLDLDLAYRKLIKPTAEERSIICVRSDEITRSGGTINQPLYEELLEADIVIADLSTSHPNSFYELGVRHALRPYSTIHIGEDQLVYPFDTNHSIVLRYHHLGDTINIDEIARFRSVLGEQLDRILNNPVPNTDSPVYTFLASLTPPSLSRYAIDVVKEVAMPASPLSDFTETFASVIEQGEQALRVGDFITAKILFEKSTNIRGQSDVYDPYLIRRLVLATYKAKEPTALEALFKARKLLELLSPKQSNDTETIELLGQIELAIYEQTRELNRLVRARQAYERLHTIRREYHSGIQLANLLSLHAEHRKNLAEALADVVYANRLRREVVDLGKAKLAEIDAISRFEDQASGASKSEEKAKERFWIWSAIAEAYYGLGDLENYSEARNEAYLIQGASWMIGALDTQLQRLATLWQKQQNLLSTVEHTITPASPLASGASPALPSHNRAMEVTSSSLVENPTERDLVFFSYSHKDVAWLNEIKKTLTPAFRNQPVSLWYDEQIKPGQVWREEIKSALSRAKAAILLVSRDFLDSKFIADHELPKLLQEAGKKGVTLLWIAIEESLYDDAEFEQYQCLNNPEMPLASLDEKALRREIVSISRKIRDSIFPK